jgi:hypothetical protein
LQTATDGAEPSTKRTKQDVIVAAPTNEKVITFTGLFNFMFSK